MRRGNLVKILPLATPPAIQQEGTEELLPSWRLNEGGLGALDSPPSPEDAMLLGVNDPVELGWAQLQAITLGLFSSEEEARGLLTKKHQDPLGKEGPAPPQVRSLPVFHAPASPTPPLASVLGKHRHC